MRPLAPLTRAQRAALVHVALTGDFPPGSRWSTRLALQCDRLGFDVARIDVEVFEVGDSGRGSRVTGPYRCLGEFADIAAEQPAVRRARVLEALGMVRVEDPFEHGGRKRRRARVWYVDPATGGPIVQLCTRTAAATLWAAERRANRCRQCLGSLEAGDDIEAALIEACDALASA